jgi:hypothetical protein
LASSAAWRTASRAVSEPSVPTTIDSNIARGDDSRGSPTLGPATQLSLTIATIMPTNTTTTIAPWSHSQVGDMAPKTRGR